MDEGRGYQWSNIPDREKEFLVVGSFDKIYQELGWKPVIPWERTLSDMIATMSD